MFDSDRVLPAPSPPAPSAVHERVHALRQRIQSMQSTRLETRLIPTHSAFAELLPGGGLQEGAAYSVHHSAMLLMALLATPSAAGAWCGVIGVPEFGAEAARHAGVELDRLVLVPHPGDQWLTVTAAVADALRIVVVRPPQRSTDANIARLAARLRQHGTTLLVLGAWPQTQAALTLSASEWCGIGSGHGHLAARLVTVTATSRAAMPKSAHLWLPDAEGRVRLAASHERLGSGSLGGARLGHAQLGRDRRVGA